MTSREARTLRRAAERRAAKEAAKTANGAPIPPPVGFVPQTAQSSEPPVLTPATTRPGFVSQPVLEPSKRAEINRANSLHSTGPKTREGRMASSGNSLKHGLASGTVIIPGEDPAAFEALLRDLFEEHEPANTTEELLINKIAQSYWLAQRAIRLQNECFTENGLDEKRLSLLLRYQTTHDRACHKALGTLLKLQRRERKGPVTARGFVPQADAHPQKLGFVPQCGPEKAASSAPNTQFVRQSGPKARAEAA